MVLGVSKMTSGPWTEAIEQLRNSLKYGIGDADQDVADVRDRVAALVTALQPDDLSDRVRLSITAPPADFGTRESGFVDYARQRVAEFAQTIVAEGRVHEVLGMVSRGNQQRSLELGQDLGTAVADCDALLADIIDVLRTVEPSERNVGTLSGCSRGACS